MPIIGGGSLDITMVAFKVTDPVSSSAVIPISTPVTVSMPTSLSVGVPDSVRELLSSESQAGAFERE